jgi:hypothetical protein
LQRLLELGKHKDGGDNADTTDLRLHVLNEKVERFSRSVTVIRIRLDYLCDRYQRLPCMNYQGRTETRV